MNRLGHYPYLCLITPGECNLSNFETEKKQILKTVREAVDDGVNLVQIREKVLPGKFLFQLVGEVVDALRNSDAIVLVNDRPDVALAAAAHGVHLPETSMPVSVVRRAFGDDLVIGVSTHTIDGAKAAVQTGADYLFYGPVFETPGKAAPVGLGALSRVCDAVGSFPVLALGGIDETNAGEVLRTRAAGIAAIRGLNERESRRSICTIAAAFKSEVR